MLDYWSKIHVHIELKSLALMFSTLLEPVIQVEQLSGIFVLFFKNSILIQA